MTKQNNQGCIPATEELRIHVGWNEAHRKTVKYLRHDGLGSLGERISSGAPGWCYGSMNYENTTVVRSRLGHIAAAQ